MGIWLETDDMMYFKFTHRCRVVVTVFFPYCPLYHCTGGNNWLEIILYSCSRKFMAVFNPFLFLKLTGSNSYLMFDCVLADRGSFGNDDWTQNSKEKVVCSQWWGGIYHGCQDQKDQKVEKIWRKRKYICCKFLRKFYVYPLYIYFISFKMYTE